MKISKRLMAILLGVLMIVSMLPVSALAAEDTELTEEKQLTAEGTEKAASEAETNVEAGKPDLQGGSLFEEGQGTGAEPAEEPGNPEIENPVPPDGGEEADIEVASDLVASGGCGKIEYTLSWTLDNAGTLTISGEGEMRDYDEPEQRPWYRNGEDIQKIVINPGVTSIGDYAFYAFPNLTSVSIPEGVQSVGSYAFQSCFSLLSVILPGGVTTIGNRAFLGCTSLTSISVPQSLTTIGTYAFYGCSSLSSFVIPDGITSIEGVFSSCSSLSSITIPQSVTTIGPQTFSGCKRLTGIELPAGVTSIGYEAFSGCTGLTSIIIPEGVTGIGSFVFNDCTNLSSIRLPDQVTHIDYGAFEDCESLAEIIIPASVTNIGKRAFSRCAKLANVYYAGSEAQWLEITIETDDNYCLNNATKFFNCTGPVIDYGRIINTGENPWTIELETSFEDCVLSTVSTEYNPTLSYYLAGLSRAIYEEADIQSSLVSIGFDYENAAKQFADNPFQVLSGYVIAKKQTDGKNIVLITIRGSKGYNWNTLLYMKNGTGWYSALEADANSVFHALQNTMGIHKDNTIYVITGHSQGAGAANLLAVKLINECAIPPEHVYDYNYACPNVASFPNNSHWNPDGIYSDIYNIGSTGDPVPCLPNSLVQRLRQRLTGETGQIYEWGKYGISRWFRPGKDNQSSFGHDMIFYVRELSKKPQFSELLPGEQIVAEIKNKKQNLTSRGFKGRVFASRCPVDVTVYDASGEPVAGVINNQPCYYTEESGILISVIEEEKWFYLPYDQEYNIKISATDEGEMQILAADCISGDTEFPNHIVFSSVTLSQKKTMTTMMNPEIPADEVRLLVLDENDVPVREVKEDGTEILYLEDPAQRPESLTIDREYLILRTSGEEVLETEKEQLQVTNLPESWLPFLEWSSDKESVVMVDPTSGRLTPVSEGTATIKASIDTGEDLLTARCRVDVVDDEGGSETPIADDVGKKDESGKPLNGVSLLDSKTTVELYKTDYTRIRIVPNLSQNVSIQSADDVILQDPDLSGTGAAVTGAYFDNREARNYFDLHVVDDRTLEIVPKDIDGQTVPNRIKGSYTSGIMVVLENLTDTPFEAGTLKLTVKKSMPKVKVAAVKLNSWLQNPKDEQALVFTGGTVTAIEATNAESLASWIDPDQIENGTIQYTGSAGAKPSGKLKLLLTVEGWSIKQAATVSVRATNTAPKLKFTPATLTLKPGTKDSASTAVKVTPALSEEHLIKVGSVYEGKKDVTADAVLQATYADGILTVTPGSAPDEKAHTYRLWLQVDGKDAGSVTVKTLATKASVSLSVKATGTIDTAIPNSPITLTPTWKNFHTGSGESVSLVKIQKAAGKSEPVEITDWFRATPNGNTFVISLKSASELAEGQEAFTWEKGYTYSAVLEGDYGADGPASATVKLNIRASTIRPVISLALKAAGSIDVLRPGTTSITVTPTVKNWYNYDLSADQVTFSAKSGKTAVSAEDLGEPFDVTVEEGKYVITPKLGAELNHSWKYTATVRLPTLPAAETASTKTVALKIVQGKAKVTQQTKAVDLLKRDRYSTAKVTLAPTDAQLSIDQVELDVKSRQQYQLGRLSDDTWQIAYLDHTVKNQKNGTVKLQVFLTGNLSGKPNTTLSLKVNIR